MQALVCQEENKINNDGYIVLNSSRHRTQKCAIFRYIFDYVSIRLFIPMREET